MLAIIVLLCTFAFCLNGIAEQPRPIKVILDCDMGYMNDDALSLSMLIKAEERGLVEILGITLEGGNSFIEVPYVNYGETQYGSAENTRALLEALKREDIPYFAGTDFPAGFDRDNIHDLDVFYKGLDYIKFNDGYGAIHFFEAVDPEMLCSSDDAVGFLRQSVRENPDEVVILAIGPTMNIAEAVRKDSEFASHVKAIYYMGGAFGNACMMENSKSEQVVGINGANVTPVTEYNVLYDPVAFYTCITASFPKQYILPGSCSIGIDRSIADRFIGHSDGTGISGLWADYYKSNVQDYPYWDPMTVYALLCPEAITESSVEFVTVDTDRSSATFGRTDSCLFDEYVQLASEEQLRRGRAEIIFGMEGFWDYSIELLCN